MITLFIPNSAPTASDVIVSTSLAIIGNAMVFASTAMDYWKKATADYVQARWLVELANKQYKDTEFELYTHSLKQPKNYLHRVFDVDSYPPRNNRSRINPFVIATDDTFIPISSRRHELNKLINSIRSSQSKDEKLSTMEGCYTCDVEVCEDARTRRNKIILIIKKAIWLDKAVRLARTVLWLALSICKPARIGQDDPEYELYKAQRIRPRIRGIPTTTVVARGIYRPIRVNITNILEIITGTG